MFTRHSDSATQKGASGLALGDCLIVAAFTAVTGLLFLHLLSRIEIECNDDTYVYFNYARNFVAGRFFAYDARGLRSEGFSSLFYLLLLIPFEYAGSNMMLTATLIQIGSLLAAVAMATAIVSADRLLPSGHLGPFLVLFAALLAFDGNISEMIGRGLETLLGTASVLLALLFQTLCCRAHARLRLWTAGFLAASFLAYLTRPESLLALGISGLLLLRRHPRPRLFVRHTVFFLLVLLAYHAGKWAIFGDLFPTGYYRKVSFGDTPGTEYVAGALTEYAPWIAGAILLGLFWAAVDRRQGRRQWLLESEVALPALAVAVTTVVFTLKVTPLVGYSQRYLATAILILYFFCAVLVIKCVPVPPRLATRMHAIPPRVVAWAAGATLGLGLLSCVWLSSPGGRLDLRARAARSVARHSYLRLGHFLRKRIPDYESVSLAFGDAGCIPYSSGFRFIDTNGLTEPYLARLFRLRDPEAKARLLAEYVLRWRPDVILEPQRQAGASQDEIILDPSRHSPLFDAATLGVHERYRDAGYEYLCSVKAYYPLHVLVLRDSAHVRQIARAFWDYCAEGHGYVLPEGFKVRLQERTVWFKRLRPEALPESATARDPVPGKDVQGHRADSDR